MTQLVFDENITFVTKKCKKIHGIEGFIENKANNCFFLRIQERRIVSNYGMLFYMKKARNRNKKCSFFRLEKSKDIINNIVVDL